MNLDLKKLVLVWIVLSLLAPMGFKIGGATILDFTVYSMIGLSLMDWFRRGKRLKRFQMVEKWLLYLLLVVIASYLYNLSAPFEEQKAFVAFLGLSPDFLYIRLCIYGVMTILMVFCGYHLAISIIKEPEDVRLVVKVFLVCGFVNALVSIIYWAVATGCTLGRYNFIPPIEDSQGIHLIYMSLVCLIAIALLISGELSRHQKFFAGLVAGSTSISMLTVLVRQAWVMFFVSVVLLFLLYTIKFPSRRIFKGVVFLSLVLAAGAIAVVITNREMLADLFLEAISVSGTDTNQGSWLMRFALIQHGLDIFTKNPILGVGFGHYIAYSTVPVVVTGHAKYVSSPHNGVVTILAETGIVGFICLLGISFKLLQQHHSAYRLCRSKLFASVVCAVYAFLIIAVVSQVISNSQILPLPTERSMTQSSFILWILFGLVAAIGRMCKGSEKGERV